MMKFIIILFIILSAFGSFKLYSSETEDNYDSTQTKYSIWQNIVHINSNFDIIVTQDKQYNYQPTRFGLPFLMNLSYKDIELNSSYDGSLNLLNFQGTFINSQSISKFSQVSPTYTLNLSNKTPTKSAINAFVNFSKNKLLADINFDYVGSLFYFDSDLNFRSNNNLTIAENESSLVKKKGILENSYSDGLTLTFKAGIDEVNSKLSAEYIHINCKRFIPINYLASTPEFLKENQNKFNLFRIYYNSKISNKLSLIGSINYKDNNRILDRYDNDKYNSQTYESSFRNILKEQQINFTISTNYIISTSDTVNFGVQYTKLKVFEKANFGLKGFEYITENFSLYCSSYLKLFDIFETTSEIKYKYLSPVYPQSIAIKSNSLLEYSININYKLSQNSSLRFQQSSNSAFPFIKYSFAKNIPILDLANSNISNIEFNYRFRNFKTSIEAFYTSFSNYFLQAYNTFEFIKGNTAGSAIEISANTKYTNLLIKYNYNKSLYTITNALFIPEHQILFKMEKSFQFGFKYEFDYTLFNKINSKNSFTNLFDIFLYQKVINNIGVFVYFQNIFNEYYELYSGFPSEGRSLMSGVSFHF